VAGDREQRVPYVVVCAAPPAADVEALVRLAQSEGWRARVITSPMGRRFIDADRLAELTGEPVRSEYRMPDEPDELPAADAVIVAPATFNTINKWACGIADTFAVGLLCELTGFGVPIVAVPLLKNALARHIAFGANLDALRSMGVWVGRERSREESGGDRNDFWSAFGPTNVVIHEVSIAVTFGDAKLALQQASRSMSTVSGQDFSDDVPRSSSILRERTGSNGRMLRPSTPCSGPSRYHANSCATTRARTSCSPNSFGASTVSALQSFAAWPAGRAQAHPLPAHSSAELLKHCSLMRSKRRR
jgi:hypothetical protein